VLAVTIRCVRSLPRRLLNCNRRESYSYTYNDTNAHIHCDSNSHTNCNAASYTEATPDSAASPYAATLRRKPLQRSKT
jgi:hypothetical protein